MNFRAYIFDIYGTLLIAPPGRVQPDPLIDPILREIILTAGYQPPLFPTTALHDAVSRHHAAAHATYPEIDLRILWRGILKLENDAEITHLIAKMEAAWHPATMMPGAAPFIQQLANSGALLGVLSNAQCNTLKSLGEIANYFDPQLTVLSYQHGIAKPSPELFELIRHRLADRNITPTETLYIGNDPLHDIIPAAAAGFRTALFTGHASSHRPGTCQPNYRFTTWPDLELPQNLE